MFFLYLSYFGAFESKFKFKISKFYDGWQINFFSVFYMSKMYTSNDHFNIYFEKKSLNLLIFVDVKLIAIYNPNAQRMYTCRKLPLPLWFNNFESTHTPKLQKSCTQHFEHSSTIGTELLLRSQRTRWFHLLHFPLRSVSCTRLVPEFANS